MHKTPSPKLFCEFVASSVVNAAVVAVAAVVTATGVAAAAVVTATGVAVAAAADIREFDRVD